METARKGWARFWVFLESGVFIFSVYCKPSVHDFKTSHRLWFFQKTVIIKRVWKWINWRWMARFRILDQTSHFHVQFRKRHAIHVHWAGNQPKRRWCFVGINFLRGNNHIARPKSPKYMFTERLAISLPYSSFGFKLDVFPIYYSA